MDNIEFIADLIMAAIGALCAKWGIDAFREKRYFFFGWFLCGFVYCVVSIACFAWTQTIQMLQVFA